MTGPLRSFSLSVDQPTILLYADITDDYNPIHVNPEFARGTAMGGVIAHGTMAMNLLWESLEASCAGARSAITLDIRFLAPVRPGDVIHSGGDWQPKTLQWDVWVRTQGGEVVIAGTACMGLAIRKTSVD